MYQRNITEKIVDLQALGFSASETVDYLRSKNKVRIGINTVYRHRKSATAREIVDELIRRQERAIATEEAHNPALAMKYRDKLLDKLLPLRIEQTVDQTVTLTGMPWMLDPNAKKAFLADAERQREERANAQPGASGSGQG